MLGMTGDQVYELIRGGMLGAGFLVFMFFVFKYS